MNHYDDEPEITQRTPEEEAAYKALWDAKYLAAIKDTAEDRAFFAHLAEELAKAGFHLGDYATKAKELELTSAQAAFQKVEDAAQLARLVLEEAVFWLDRARELVDDPAGSITGIDTPVIHSMDVRPCYHRDGYPIWEVRAAPIEGDCLEAIYRGEWYFTIDEAKKRTGILDVTIYADWKGMSERLPVPIYENVTVTADAAELSWTPHEWATALREKAAPIIAKLIFDHEEHYRKMREEIEGEVFYEDEEAARAAG
ncbi:hypothetical protein ELG97_37015 [Rhizobium leguminosarum]|uniref:hypothetical protein n=1 Tax=Rhizobium leguminosarum TaxID=384 RepID=UPI0010324C68|nr:hypothetical protein [Rhizobium leguminosarum]TBE73834.1 hypothetical protein ELG97_37015 [Rhizobium leguminosarum]